MLFAGPSHTGKTMAAQAIAKELQMDLYRVDLSNVVNKYIGKTEKNLDKVFQKAEARNAILFFHEADALLSKTTEVSDGHDRYGNMQTNYLLQRLERFEGIVIPSSNLRSNVDNTFVRPLSFAVDFPLPEERAP